MIRVSIACTGLAILALVMGCGSEGDPPVAQEPESEALPEGFSWVVPGELAVMPLPGRFESLTDDVAFLGRKGIGCLVSLTEEPPDGEVLEAAGIEQQHIPVEDFTAPTIEQMAELVAIVEASVAEGTAVGVHCTAGLGRSGTMAAAYLVSQGATADEAIMTVRDLRPGSIETEAQEAAVRDFERFLVGEDPGRP